MANLVVENLILSTQINQTLDLNEIETFFSDASYEPDQLPAVICKYHNPSRVVFITTQGRIMCTGSKTKEDATQAIDETIMLLKENNVIDESTKSTIHIESLVISKNLNVSLPLASIQTKLPSDQCTYHPSSHPWLEYRNSMYSMLLFSSGNIICTGKLSLEESKQAFKNIEDKLTSIGCNDTE